MAARTRVEDALFLWQQERFESSLLLALAAAAGSSRLRYPVQLGFSSTASLSKFLEDERIVLTGGGVLNMNLVFPGVEDPKYKKGLVPWHEVLAIFLRNQLMHDGHLAPAVSIGTLDAPTLDIGRDRLVVSPYLVLGLIRAIEVAPENRGEWPEITHMSDAVLANILFGTEAPKGHKLEYLQTRHARFL